MRVKFLKQSEMKPFCGSNMMVKSILCTTFRLHLYSSILSTNKVSTRFTNHRRGQHHHGGITRQRHAKGRQNNQAPVGADSLGVRTADITVEDMPRDRGVRGDERPK